MRRGVSCFLVCLSVFAVPAASVGAQEGEEEDQGTVIIDTVPVDPNAPEPTAPIIPSGGVETPTATTIPPECEQPVEPAAVFLGVLIAADDRAAMEARTARFKVSEMVSGSLDGFAVDGLVDLDVGNDLRYFEIGTAYKVSAEIDPETNRLRSRAKPQAPLFGGDEVVGINDSGVICPQLVDPAISTYADGTSIETGVLAPFFAAKANALERILRPVVAALGLLAALVFFKRVVLWFVARLRHWWRRRTVPPSASA